MTPSRASLQLCCQRTADKGRRLIRKARAAYVSFTAVPLALTISIPLCAPRTS